MSWALLDWAETTPVADVYERVILTQMAARADYDGTGVWLSLSTLAGCAVSDEKTMKRRVNALRERGVIAYGDQKRNAHIRADRRPPVYDLMVPAAFYSETQLAAVNKQRAEQDLPPLTEKNRPALADVAPSRKARSDTGVSRPIKATNADEEPSSSSGFTGGLVVQDAGGGSASPATGGLVVLDGGASRPPNQSLNPPSEPVRFSESAREAEAGWAADPQGDPDVFMRQADIDAERHKQNRRNGSAVAMNGTARSQPAIRIVSAFAKSLPRQLPNSELAKLGRGVDEAFGLGWTEDEIVHVGLPHWNRSGKGAHLFVPIASEVVARGSVVKPSAADQAVGVGERLRAELAADPHQSFLEASRPRAISGGSA